MSLHYFLKTVRIMLLLLVTLLFIFGAPTLIGKMYSRPKIFPVSNAPKAPVAIVFGAGLLRDGSPTPILRDRVKTAAELYFNEKVDKLLMSGDNRFVDYNEPQAMKDFALELGIPEADIVLDYAGRRTYDTCYRAKYIFGVENALLVTQSYHLPRALLTCNGLGITAKGIKSDLRNYNSRSLRFWKIREVPATLVALVEVYITHPVPVLGEPEFIFSNQQNSSLN